MTPGTRRKADSSRAASDAAPHTGAKRGGGKPGLAPLILLSAALLLVLGALVMFETRPRAGPGGGTADIGGPFQLTDQDGRAVDQGILKGKWTAVFFGYTYCPDVCPATLQTLAATQAKLGPAAKHFQVAFITVDPQRDTPAQMKLYLSNQGFPKGAWGLTGTPQQVAGVAKAYKAYYAKHGSGDDYLMDHSAIIYLMDPKGRFSQGLTEAMKPDLISRQVLQAMRAGRRVLLRRRKDWRNPAIWPTLSLP